MELSYYIHHNMEISEAHGFDMTNIPRQLLLMHSEISEAAEALRHQDQANFAEEMADLFIRWASFCGRCVPDIEEHIKAKMEVNKNRPYMHGGKAF